MLGNDIARAPARPAVVARAPETRQALWPLLAALAILLGLLCLRVWGLGVTHTDDAMWVLRSYTSYFATIDDWARLQGRLWAYVSGSLIMLSLVWQGTVLGELLRLGSFVLFFAAFHWVAAAYCGRRIALLCATLFLAFFALKWDGSILTTYPMISWPAGTACAAALLAGRAYTRDAGGGARWQLAAAGALLFVALFNNEGLTLAFIALALLSAVANAAKVDSAARGLVGGKFPRRSAQLLLVFIAVAALYASLYIGWRLAHPSSYAGNALAPFNARRILVTLYHFSTSGSALHELLAPLSLWYANPYGGGARASYALGQYWTGLAASPLALLAGALAGLLVWRLLAHDGAPEAPRAACRRATPRRCALAAGLVVALAPLVPVALVGNYQLWAMEMGVRAYSHTLFAHFGWSLVLAALLSALAGRLRHTRLFHLLLSLLTIACALLAALAYRANDAIAADLRPEAGRWALVGRAVAANRALYQSDTLWIPALAQRSQYGSLYPRYWEHYVKARFGLNTEVAARIPDINDQMHGVVMLDYAWDAGARRMVALMMHYRKNAWDGPYLGGRIAVDLGGAGAATGYVLAYRNGGALQRVPVASLAAVPGQPGLYRFDPPAATDPASVRLLRADADGGAALCAIHLPRGLRIDFKQARMAHPAFDVAGFLDAGWHALEPESVWSRGGQAHIRIPRSMLPPGALRMELDAASFTSLGFSPALQQVAASVNGKPMGKWDYRVGATPEVALELPAALLDQPVLDLRFDIQGALNPNTIGLDARDGRELGLLLRAVTFLPATAVPD